MLTSNSSCLCPGYERNGSKVYCKHTIYLVLYVLGNEKFLTSLKERCFSEDDLKFLFRNKDIPELYRQPQEVLKRPRNFRQILQSHQDYDGQQQWSLHRKKVKKRKMCIDFCVKKTYEKELFVFQSMVRYLYTLIVIKQ